jgi:inorganic pyrophosphatase
MEYNLAFWNALDQIVRSSEIIIDRPKGTRHPKYPDLLYEVDYGYLKGTTSMDGDGIDVWKGTDPDQKIDAIMCIVDLKKKDSEMKILVGCTEVEKEKVYHLHNDSEYMKGIMIRRQ